MLVLGLFMALTVFCVPSSAYADVTDECADNKFDQALRDQSAATAHEIWTLSNYVINTFGAIDISAQHCLDRLTDFYNKMMELELGVLDPLQYIVGQVFRKFVQDFLIKMCDKVLSTVESLKTFVLSQLNKLCMPIPNLSISLPQMSSLGNAECSSGSIPVLTVSPAPDYQPWDKYVPDDMIPTRSGR